MKVLSILLFTTFQIDNQQQQPQQQQVIAPKVVKCSEIGIVTLIYVITSCFCFLACMISGLCIDDTWLPFSYMALNPASIFTKGEVWRLVTSYITPSSFWNCILINMWLCLMLYKVEQKMGHVRMLILLLIDIILCSLIVSAFDAFFGLIPGINNWSYLSDWWNVNVNYNLGQSPMIIIFTIQEQRILQNQNVICCCFQMPFWAYMIILYILCQAMVYPPWYGIEYNLAGLIVGYLIPRKFLTKQEAKGIYVKHNNQQNANQSEFQVINNQQKEEQQKQQYNQWSNKGGHTL